MISDKRVRMISGIYDDEHHQWGMRAMTMIKTIVEMVNKSNLLVFWHFQSASRTLPNQLDTGGRH